ncbi:MAG: serine/threonine protein kinase [Deltaproteobacteria bacterium]|nr:serine/threonine protein kinase [Deltaproteobacteria bacterium]
MGDEVPSSTRRLLGRALRDGRYVISGVLGSGSQGATLEAVDKRDGRLVAIKRFQVRGARSWKDVELAEREARVLSKLSHPLLPHAIEHFEEEGALYLVMERIEGETLASLGTLGRDEVVGFLHSAAEILEYLHGRTPPVIHRDIKPSNAIRRTVAQAHGEDRVEFVLVDFGSVRDSLKPAGGSTVVGTFGYMAPEQFQGRAKPASDVYAVGVCALRMLTGIEPEDLPHRGLAIDVAAALGDGDPPLVRALSAMVEPNPDERAGTLRPLLAELSEPGGGTESPARPGARDDGAQPGNRRPRPAQATDDRGGHGAAGDAGQPADGALDTVLFPPMAAAAVLGLTFAELVVWATTHVAVPMLLTLLSVVFGRGLRRAAVQVRAAGRRARQTIRRARNNVHAGQPTRGRRANPRAQRAGRRGRGRGGRAGAGRGRAGTSRKHRAGPGRQRIEPPDPPVPTGVRIEEGITETLADLEDALDEAMEDLGEGRRKGGRRDR